MTVSDQAVAVAILKRLGYWPRLTFEKRRQTWRIDDCEVVVDELPHLGHFLEVEGPAEPVIRNILAKLGLASEPLIREGYAELVVAHLAANPGATMQFK